MVTVSEAMEQAFRAHSSGKILEAEWLCQQVIEQQPNHISALHLLGAIAQQTGRLETAIACYQAVLALDPNHGEAHGNLAVALQAQGNLEAAMVHFHTALELNPIHAPTHFNLGNLRLEQKEFDAAIAHYEQAIALKPAYARAHNNLAQALRGKGNLAEAMAHYQQAVVLEPNNAQFYNNLGSVFQENGALELAIAQYQKSLELQPQNPQVYFNLARAFGQLGRQDAAIHHYEQALELNPNWAEAHNNLALAMQAGGVGREELGERSQEREGEGEDKEDKREGEDSSLSSLTSVIYHLQQAIALKPDYAEAHNNLAVALYEKQDLVGAIAQCQRAIELQPDYAEAHLNLSLALLASGDLLAGLAEFEWRWQFPDFQLPPLPGDRWEGEDLQGRSILLRTEQGFGDAIQFIRYATPLAERGGRVMVQCPPELLRLFSTVTGVEQCISIYDAAPEVDFHLPLLSAPLVLANSLETIPNQVPYLQGAEVELPDKLANGLNVGIVWGAGEAGDRAVLRSRNNRTASLPLFMALQSVPHLKLYSLQVGSTSAEIIALGFNNLVQDLSSQIQDFADTAALIAQVDLVISVDTAVAHLAGALGKPVWVVLPYSADWRWLLNRADSPWYPSLRLFRQPQPGDWAGAIAQVMDALAEDRMSNPQIS